MDPVSLIIAALVAGAAAGLQDSATDAVKSAYTSFKALLRRRLGHGDPAVEDTIKAVEAGPAADTTTLRRRLDASAITEDDELTAAARALLDRLPGSVTVNITDSKGVIGVNQGQSVMNFSDGS
jgi:hypothetical protein